MSSSTFERRWMLIHPMKFFKRKEKYRDPFTKISHKILILKGEKKALEEALKEKEEEILLVKKQLTELITMTTREVK